MSYGCNSRCVFCYNPYRQSSVDYSKIKQIVRSVYNSCIPHVYLIGGEPSLLGTKNLNAYINLLARNSSVTIVTNGLTYKAGLSDKLACIGIPIHGDKKTHEMLTGVKGGYGKVVRTIKRYVRDGFDVRCIPVLMSINYNQIYKIIRLAKELGMESVFVDRFEMGGIASKATAQLKPSLLQFKGALSQMIAARNDFDIPVGFGTAIPFCLDERLITENMWADCGVGVTFGAINPQGDFRICNQSNIVYGNVLQEPIGKIWNKKKIDEFRNLRWVDEPCRRCPLLQKCTCGCKVDLTCSKKYCADYAVRENREKLIDLEALKKSLKMFLKEEDRPKNSPPKKYREFVVNKYIKLNLRHKEKYLVTRYQTIVLNETAIKIIKAILNGINSENGLISKFNGLVGEKELRTFVTNLIKVGAIDQSRSK